MSNPAADMLDRAGEEFSLRERRVRHAARVVRAKLDELFETQDESWMGFVEAIVHAGNAQDWDRVAELILQGYRRIRIEQDPATSKVDIPRTDEEWDRRPDILTEFKKRFGDS